MYVFNAHNNRFKAKVHVRLISMIFMQYFGKKYNKNPIEVFPNR